MADDIVVFITRHAGTCVECGTEFFKGNFIRVEEGRTLCLGCADLDHLEFLPRGDTALTRRATKHAPLRAVVVQWARARNRYERQGILVAPEAIRRAEHECLDDADLRARQRERAAERRTVEDLKYVGELAQALQALFPRCPPPEIDAIARWTGEKHTGRVGRSAAAKDFDPAALRLAVVAHIRHGHTDYDERLMRGEPRDLARRSVQSQIEHVLQRWS